MSAVTKMFTPKMPKAPAPVAMPDPNDLRARLENRKKIEKQVATTGRQGTILSGGDGYNRTTTGAA